MAGGPSTPELVLAAERAGGIGQLAAGYLTADRLAADVAAVRELGGEAFGVNLFFPEAELAPVDVVAGYREALLPVAEELGVELPAAERLREDDDAFAAKLDVVTDLQVPLVTLTFGCPDRATVERLHAAGCAVGVTVTTPEDAARAAEVGADLVCAQGPEAGGHRSTFAASTPPPTVARDELLVHVVASLDVPVVVAGGIFDAPTTRRLLDLGASAVQVGTLLLRTPEAGTKPAHAGALADPRFAETVITRAFSGRPARGLRNAFIDRFDTLAPSAYPQVNSLTAPLRRATPDDPDGLSLWAGTGYREARAEPAVDAMQCLLA